MSNQQVGNVYSKIMDEVLDQVAIAFEEDGVNHSVLDELKKTWQRRLTSSKCAAFPWDPPPIPQPMPNPTPVPSNVPRPQQGPATVSPSLSNNSPGSGGVTVKQEPSYGNHGLPNGIQPNYGNSVAQQRAAQHLQQKYPNAHLQINQLQAQAAMSNPGQQQQNPQNIQLPQMNEHQHRAYIERQRSMHMQQMQQAQQTQGRPQVSDAQTDGTAEWDGMVAERRAASLANPSTAMSADLTIRQQLVEASHAMEGGGLMLPLSEQPKRLPIRKQTVSSLSIAQSTSAPKTPQYDGAGDTEEDTKAIKDEDAEDDEDDEDAINSDLDDPDDDVVEEVGEDSNQGQIMLCTYDKVQRVKNKWKCILKDGVLTTGGKELLPWYRAFLALASKDRLEASCVSCVDKGDYLEEQRRLSFRTPTTPALYDTHHEFPLPSIPLPRIPPASAKQEIIKPDPSSQNSQKENVVPDSPTITPPAETSILSEPAISSQGTLVSAPSGTLPPPIISLLDSIKSNLRTGFPDAPPHTVQRLAELILRPRSHYRMLPSWIRALDRVVSVSSPTTVFPLPTATPAPGGGYLNGTITPTGNNETDPDDTLGGAALTPIPWLRETLAPAHAGERTVGSDLRTESTSVIDGPNGVGSIETVTVAVNGNNARQTPTAVTQGELIRQEQQAGVVPVPMARSTAPSAMGRKAEDAEEDEDSIPHARGPELIGMEDMGPQASSSAGFDVEAALGRKGEGEAPRTKAAPAEVEKEPEGDRDGDGDVEVVDADGSTEGDEKKADSVGQNVGSDAADTRIVVNGQAAPKLLSHKLTPLACGEAEREQQEDRMVTLKKARRLIQDHSIQIVFAQQ
ncbi:MAG: hypothetical protein Q9216_004830 [Gyalolechia sp. 2 TL-2023]